MDLALFFLGCQVLSMILMCCKGPISFSTLLVTKLRLATTVNGYEYNMGYYLADGIYLEWATLMKTICNPEGRAEAEFAKAQEAAWKDIERAFGVLQARFAIVRGPSRFWDKGTLQDIMTTCVILHNMIIEDEKHLNLEFFFDNVGTGVKLSRIPDKI
jgi:hypothetical protein